MTALRETEPARTWPRPDNVLRLKDGRVLGYAEYGDPTGRPAFLFHGMPGSRLEGAVEHEAAARRGVRMIWPDRPGYGLSDFKPRRTIIDWPADVVELADALGIERFGVAGMSGGGPYVAACALRIPGRLTGAAIVSGMGPLGAPGATDGMNIVNRLLFLLARRAPWTVRPAMWAYAQVALRWPDVTRRILPEPDRAVLSRPEIMRISRESAIESARAGTRAAAWEAMLYARPWGFRLEDIGIHVHLWQGERDTRVPAAMGHYQASAIPNCKATFYPDEGHTLSDNHIEEIFDAIVGCPTI